jgi:UDP-GlcNAc:undecaprenyl-phosphate/decaprenyl-phosphate GlcNAc-1-phosphate transferase
MLEAFFPIATGFLVSLAAMVALRPLAIAIDLVDRPGGRKTHHGNVPVFGGLAILLGMLVASGLVPAAHQVSAVFFAGCGLLVTTGLLDDRFDISPWARLPVQAAAATLIGAGSATLVHTLGSPFGGGAIDLQGVWSVLITLIFVMGAINAFNMLDGMDGLAGAAALIALLPLGYVSLTADMHMLFFVSAIAGASVVAFLIFNLPARYNRSVRCFMGDAGSTLLGFILAWLCISVSQAPESPVAPVTTLWFVAMPLYELLCSTVRRVVRGVSPMQADRDHFHHLLLKAGLGVRGAFFVIVLLASTLALVGLGMHAAEVPDHWSFVWFLVCGALVVRLMHRASVFLALLPASFRRIPTIDLSGEQGASQDT